MSCKKDNKDEVPSPSSNTTTKDVTPPTMAFSIDTIRSLNVPYTPSAPFINDDVDGYISTYTVTGTVDVNLAGVYTLTYSASDKAGNTATANRNIYIVNEVAAFFGGNYNVSEVDLNGTYNYTTTVYASSTVNNRVIINDFSDFNNNNIYFTLTNFYDFNFTIPSQSYSNVGVGSGLCDVHTRQTIGTGEKSQSANGGFTITFDDFKVNPCTGSRTGVVATFVKQ